MRLMAIVAATVLLCPSFVWCQTTSVDEVVGEYSTGASLMAFGLKLNQDSTFTFTEYGDLGDVTLAGTYTFTDGTVHLNKESLDGLMMWYFLYGSLQDLLLVPWGEREYLVTRHQLTDFCNHINAGWEPRSDEAPGPFLLRDGDAERPAPGLPDLPKEWRKCLFDPPLVAEVVATDSESFVLNVGDSSNVFEGMEFWPVDPEVAPHCHFEVISIEPDTSRAKPNDSCEIQAESGVLPVGLVVSTRQKH